MSQKYNMLFLKKLKNICRYLPFKGSGECFAVFSQATKKITNWLLSNK
jgi:hypothetical protein